MNVACAGNKGGIMENCKGTCCQCGEYSEDGVEFTVGLSDYGDVSLVIFVCQGCISEAFRSLKKEV